MSNTDIADRAENDWTANGGQAKLFSGHESFACRYGWLVKLYHALEDDPKLFANDEDAILALGLGKNMVKPIRFWGQAFGLTRAEKGKTLNTEFAHRLMHSVCGIDPYLEDIGSLWRLHWQIATRARLGVWAIVLQDVFDARITRDRLIALTEMRAASAKRAISQGTASAHVDIFLRTYDWSRAEPSSALEEGAGSPFQELKLIETMHTNGGVVIALNRGPKPDLRMSDLAFALRDFWRGTASESERLSLRSLQLDKRGPASIFRLDEGSLHVLLEELSKEAGFEIESDGAGEKVLAARKGDHLDRLEALAWQNK